MSGRFLLEDGGDLLLESGASMLLEGGDTPVCAGIIVPSTATGILVIDGTPTVSAAWTPLDLTALQGFAPQRGQDLIIPGAAGQRPKRRRRDSYSVDIGLLMAGDVDKDGNPYTDWMTGLQTNLAYLTTNIFDPPALPAKTRTAVLTLPDGSSKTAQVHVSVAYGGLQTDVLRIVMTILIPSGRFV